jgi:hypothetical protein
MQAPTATALFFLPDGADDSETPSPYFTDRPLAIDSVGQRDLLARIDQVGVARSK